MKGLKKLVFAWLPLTAWMGLIFGLSAVPGTSVPDAPVPHFDRLVHFAEYSVLGALVLRGFFHFRLRDRWFVALCMLIILAFALSDEGHQGLVPGRTPDPADLLVDTVAAMIGMNFYAAGSLASVKRKRPKNKGGKICVT